MNNLQSSTLILPVIALVLVVVLYLFLLKKTIDKTAFKRFTFICAVVAFLLNFAWEMLQMPLYIGMELNFKLTVFCALASVADTVMVLLMYYGFALIYKSCNWIESLTVQRTFALVIVGGAGAILAEIRHTWLGTWAYSDTMPIIPVVHVGLSPVLQFMILPCIIYYTAYYVLKNTTRKNKLDFTHT